MKINNSYNQIKAVVYTIANYQGDLNVEYTKEIIQYAKETPKYLKKLNLDP